MKNLSLILICLAFFYSCKEQASKPNTNTSKTQVKKSTGKVEDFECATFFEKGDYSPLCFTDLKSPNQINRGCIFDFVTKGDKQEQGLKIQFSGKSSSMLAEMSFNLIKGNSLKGELKDIPNLGDAAFFDVHGTDLKSLSRSNKDLHVRYKNITFVIMAEYLTNKETPCFYSDKEMIALADIIISNM